MSEQYSIINIRTYLDKGNASNEIMLRDIISDFSCPDNPDVEHFLHNNAVEFTKKDQSVTYLVFNSEDASLAGYFSLAVKPISVKAVNVSKTMSRKLSRVSILDETSESYCTAAYLIAQLGKNYALPKSKRIDGSLLLEFASATVMKLKYSVGGVMEFLECENTDFLMDFYTRNNFKFFDVRTTSPTNDSEPHQLNQLLKIL
jgi:hypothetical protein